LKISKIGITTCNLVALLNTGSYISFISRQTFDNFLELASSTVSNCSFNALNDTSIQIKNSVTITIKLELLLKIISNVILHILENNILSYNLILGRDFLIDNNISFTYTPLCKNSENRVQLFSEITTVDIIATTLSETTRNLKLYHNRF